MPRNRAQARRALARIERAGENRAEEIAQFIVSTIRILAPYDPRTTTDTHGEHLRDAYRAKPDPNNPGEWIITCNRRYWVFVEFGTAEHGDAQPHVRPAIEAARRVFGG